MAGPLKTTRTDNVDLNNAVRDVKDFADQLEDARQGVIAYPASIISQRAQLRDEAMVSYRGPATTLSLPPAMQRGRGKAQTVFIANKGSGSLTIVPTKPPSGGQPDVLVGGNYTLPVGNWAIFESDGYQNWYVLSNVLVPTGVTSMKANAGGTPRTGALELDGTGAVTVTDSGGGVFTINAPVAGASVTSLKANAGGTPQTGALELDGAGVVAVSNAGGVFTINGTAVGSLAASTGGPFTGSVSIVGGGDIVTSGAAGTITVTGPRDASYWDYAPNASAVIGQQFYVASCDSCGATTNRTSTANTAVGVPFVAPLRGGTVDRMDFEVTTLVAASNGRMALYDNLSDTNPWPNNLLNDGGTISTASTGLKQSTLSVALTGGRLYWLVVNFSANSVIHRALSLAQTIPILGSASAGGGNFNIFITVALTFGAYPSTFPTAGGSPVSSAGGSFAPLLRYRML